MLRDEEPLLDPERAKNDRSLDDNVRRRLSGQLPIINIYEHPFYVDIRNDRLRPKDDFSTLGISFKQIDPYFLENEKVYRIPYDPKAQEFKQLDHDTITAVPKRIVVVDIPTMDVLDPVAYAWMHGIPRKDILEQIPMKMHSEARVTPWEQTPILRIIGRNLERDAKKILKEAKDSEATQKPQRKKGKRL